MSSEIQSALETSKKALFILNQALSVLNTSKPKDLLDIIPVAKPTHIDDTVDSLESIKFIYASLTSCIEYASQIRNELLKLEIYDLPNARPTVSQPHTKTSYSPSQYSPTISEHLKAAYYDKTEAQDNDVSISPPE